ncbi:hypothetical protein HHL11_28845 [Ramlibacter sp. G-1-2-2]|uniref:Uncharacterized protein n=1 Tax=Ramlibacter agri TaxID=2728837 RepID=A0A848HEL1_9BURK|nr:hypothetical protein [Ramlibacter agri]NML47791.1 hypothetical protein [Ramlibacter agri]
MTATAHGLVLRATRSPLSGLAFGIACLLVAKMGLLNYDAVAQPSLFLNADSALYYVFWYALGHASFPLLRRAVPSAGFAVAGVLATIGSLWLYFNGGGALLSLLDPIRPGPMHNLASVGLGVAMVAVPIVANIGAARALEEIPVVCEVGRRTLVLCGTEDFTKLVLSQLLLVFGLKLQLIHSLGVTMYAFVALCASALLVGRLLEAYTPAWLGLGKAPARSAAALGADEASARPIGDAKTA